MDNDVILSQFDDIDEKVEHLVVLCRTFEATNDRLKSRIEMLEQEVKNKSEAEKRNLVQKEKVRIKVSDLLNKLNEFSEISS